MTRALKSALLPLAVLLVGCALFAGCRKPAPPVPAASLKLSLLELPLPAGVVRGEPEAAADFPGCEGRALFVAEDQEGRAVCYGTQRLPCDAARLLFEEDASVEGHEVGEVRLGALTWEWRNVGFGYEYARCERGERTEVWVFAPPRPSRDDAFVQSVELSLERAKRLPPAARDGASPR